MACWSVAAALICAGLMTMAIAGALAAVQEGTLARPPEAPVSPSKAPMP